MNIQEINIRNQLIKNIENLKAIDPKLENECDKLIDFNKKIISNIIIENLQNTSYIEKVGNKRRKINI